MTLKPWIIVIAVAVVFCALALAKLAFGWSI
jgi:hypothetical protein